MQQTSFLAYVKLSYHIILYGIICNLRPVVTCSTHVRMTILCYVPVYNNIIMQLLPYRRSSYKFLRLLLTATSSTWMQSDQIEYVITKSWGKVFRDQILPKPKRSLLPEPQIFSFYNFHLMAFCRGCH